MTLVSWRDRIGLMEGERRTIGSRIAGLFRALSTPIEPSRGFSPIDRFERASQIHDQRGRIDKPLEKLSPTIKEHFGVKESLSKPAQHWADSVDQI